MEKILNVGGKDVKFKATAGTMLRYRTYFGKDLIKDIMKLKDKLTGKIESGKEFEIIDLDMFEKIAWTMAKTADDNTPDIEHWLDEFEVFDIMQVLPEIIELFIANNKQLNDKKKLEMVAENMK